MKANTIMGNLNRHGRNHLRTYLRDYQLGRISFHEAKLMVGCCFYNRRMK